jgi:hypothetical protein
MGMVIAVQALRGVVASNSVSKDAPRQTNVSRTKSILVTLVVAAAIPAVQGQNATPPAAQSANQSSSAPPPSAGTTPGTGAAADPAASGQPGRADKPPAVCFKLTGRCVDAAKRPAAKAGAPAATRTDASKKGSLNLAAPDVRTVIPEGQLKEPLPTTEQITEAQEAETVQVKGEKDAPDVPGGFGALWWALNHPSQAWRILAPAE